MSKDVHLANLSERLHLFYFVSVSQQVKYLNAVNTLPSISLMMVK